MPRWRAIHSPSSSGPTAPSATVRAPSAARFSTTFPAPPARRDIEERARSGTGASGATRETSPNQVSSSIRSPTTTAFTLGAAAARAASSRGVIGRLLQPQDERLRQERQEDLVVAGDRVRGAAREDGALEDVLVRAVVANHVEVDGREVPHVVPQVSGHRESLQEDLRHDDGRAGVDPDPSAAEPGDDPPDRREVADRHLADERPVHARVLDERVGPERDVDGERDVRLRRRGEEGEVAVREAAAEDRLAERAAVADALLPPGAQRAEDPLARLAAHPELARLEDGADVLGRLPVEGDLEVVDAARAVRREGRHEAALDEVDEDRPEPRLQDVGPEGDDDRLALPPRRVDRRGDLPERLGGEDLRQAVPEVREGAARRRRRREVGGPSP